MFMWKEALKNLEDFWISKLDWNAQPTFSSVPQEGPKDALLLYHKEKTGRVAIQPF